MKFICPFVVSLLILFVSQLSCAEDLLRNALVIGNSNYASSFLTNPVNDAHDMKQILQKLNFTVKHLENAQQRTIENAVREFGENLKKGGVGLFYFAGHGLQVKGRNYLIPIGADIRVESDVKYEAIDAGRILDEMYNAQNGFNIVILDACRNNPYARSFRSGSVGLARMDSPKGTLIAYSTSPGSVAYDGSDRNSPYTKSLLYHIGTAGLSIEQVFKRTRVDVDEMTNGKQITWESTSLTADFCFNPSGIRIASINTGENSGIGRIKKNLSMGRFITFGTGGITGVYYPTGGAIAKIVNQNKGKHGFQCAVESTGGSVDNINSIMSEEREFGIAQSDRQYQAYYGLAYWKDKGPQKDLRAVFSIYPESITVVASVNSGIKSIRDIKGRRVNIGNYGSGHRVGAIDVLEAAGINYQKDIKAVNEKVGYSSQMLQKGKIDAFFYTAGHPSGLIREATNGKKKVRIIPINMMDSLLSRPYYARSTIPVSFYPGAENKKDISSIGVKATFVTSENIPNDVVYGIVKEVFENLDSFKKLHPAFKTLTKKGMLDALPAPIHPGAMQYYEEIGLR